MREMKTYREPAGFRSRCGILTSFAGLAFLVTLSACGGSGDSGGQTARTEAGAGGSG